MALLGPNESDHDSACMVADLITSIAGYTSSTSWWGYWLQMLTLAPQTGLGMQSIETWLLQWESYHHKWEVLHLDKKCIMFQPSLYLPLTPASVPCTVSIRNARHVIKHKFSSVFGHAPNVYMGVLRLRIKGGGGPFKRCFRHFKVWVYPPRLGRCWGCTLQFRTNPDI